MCESGGVWKKRVKLFQSRPMWILATSHRARTFTNTHLHRHETNKQTNNTIDNYSNENDVGRISVCVYEFINIYMSVSARVFFSGRTLIHITLTCMTISCCFFIFKFAKFYIHPLQCLCTLYVRARVFSLPKVLSTDNNNNKTLNAMYLNTYVWNIISFGISGRMVFGMSSSIYTYISTI